MPSFANGSDDVTNSRMGDDHMQHFCGNLRTICCSNEHESQDQLSKRYFTKKRKVIRHFNGTQTTNQTSNEITFPNRQTTNNITKEVKEDQRPSRTPSFHVNLFDIDIEQNFDKNNIDIDIDK